MRQVPRYDGLLPASSRARTAAQGSSKKSNTRCEVMLREALIRLGLSADARADLALPGRPDIVFEEDQVVVFCDGDFWHGRRLKVRLAKLESGHNAAYWTAKIKANVARDRRRTRQLRKLGWKVLRFWESDIKADADRLARRVALALEG